MKVGLIGCGLIGQRRLESIERTKLGQVGGVFDIDPKPCSALHARYGVAVYGSAQELIEDSRLDALVVATSNAHLAEYAQAALRSGKHVLVEKPGAVSVTQIRGLIDESQQAKRRCKVGYNLRFHPAAIKICELLENDPPLWVRAAYGHGGRPGYEREWRFQPEHSGGGETIDQGVHLLDLLFWWSRDSYVLEGGVRQSGYYRGAVEDNGYLLLKSDSGCVASMHCSVNQWKNLFRMEISTEQRLMVWEGLGTSNYGEELLTIHTRSRQGGRPETQQISYGSEPNQSWDAEWEHFYGAIHDPDVKMHSSVEQSLPIFEVLTSLDKKTLEVRRA